MIFRLWQSGHYGNIRSPGVCGVAVPTWENGCLFREGGRARGGRRSRVPTGAAVRSRPIGSEGTGFLP